MRTLQEIKDEYARSIDSGAFSCWAEYRSHNEIHEEDIAIIAKRYALEASDQTLANASKSANTIEVVDSGGGRAAVIDRLLIISQDNIPSELLEGNIRRTTSEEILRKVQHLHKQGKSDFIKDWVRERGVDRASQVPPEMYASFNKYLDDLCRVQNTPGTEDLWPRDRQTVELLEKVGTLFRQGKGDKIRGWFKDKSLGHCVFLNPALNQHFEWFLKSL